MKSPAFRGFLKIPNVMGESINERLIIESPEHSPQKKSHKWKPCPWCRRDREGVILFMSRHALRNHIRVHRMGRAYRKLMRLVGEVEV